MPIDVSDPKLYQDDTWRPLFASCAATIRCIIAARHFPFLAPHFASRRI